MWLFPVLWRLRDYAHCILRAEIFKIPFPNAFFAKERVKYGSWTMEWQKWPEVCCWINLKAMHATFLVLWRLRDYAHCIQRAEIFKKTFLNANFAEERVKYGSWTMEWQKWPEVCCWVNLKAMHATFIVLWCLQDYSHSIQNAEIFKKPFPNAFFAKERVKYGSWTMEWQKWPEVCCWVNLKAMHATLSQPKGTSWSAKLDDYDVLNPFITFLSDSEGQK